MKYMPTTDKPKPYFSVSGDDLPEIKGWKVGGTYTITAKIKMKSLSENQNNGKKETNASFDVLEINDKDFKDKSYKNLMDEGGDEEHE